MTEVIQYKSVITDEIVLHFVSKSEISSLHARYFQDPTPTDCITFPIDEPGELGTLENPSILGEIFVCPEVGAEYDPNDPFGEISLYIVHGILHLLGFDDQTEEEIKTMRKMESEIIDHLRDKNLLLSKLDKIIQEV